MKLTVKKNLKLNESVLCKVASDRHDSQTVAPWFPLFSPLSLVTRDSAHKNFRES